MVPGTKRKRRGKLVPSEDESYDFSDRPRTPVKRGKKRKAPSKTNNKRKRQKTGNGFRSRLGYEPGKITNSRWGMSKSKSQKDSWDNDSLSDSESEAEKPVRVISSDSLSDTDSEPELRRRSTTTSTSFSRERDPPPKPKNARHRKKKVVVPVRKPVGQLFDSDDGTTLSREREDAWSDASDHSPLSRPKGKGKTKGKSRGKPGKGKAAKGRGKTPAKGKGTGKGRGRKKGPDKYAMRVTGENVVYKKPDWMTAGSIQCPGIRKICMELFARSVPSTKTNKKEDLSDASFYKRHYRAEQREKLYYKALLKHRMHKREGDELSKRAIRERKKEEEAKKSAIPEIPMPRGPWSFKLGPEHRNDRIKVPPEMLVTPRDADALFNYDVPEYMSTWHRPRHKIAVFEPGEGSGAEDEPSKPTTRGTALKDAHDLLTANNSETVPKKWTLGDTTTNDEREMSRKALRRKAEAQKRQDLIQRKIDLMKRLQAMKDAKRKQSP